MLRFMRLPRRPCPPAPGQPLGLLADHGVFGFRGCAVEVGDDAVVRPSDKPGGGWVWPFEIRDRERYARAMTEATAGLLAALPVRETASTRD